MDPAWEHPITCTMSQAKKQAYWEKKYSDHTEMSVQASAEPEVYVAEEVSNVLALQAEGASVSPKHWIINSHCTTHLCPNWSDYISYTPYAVPQMIWLGNGMLKPSLGEGVISIECIIDGKQIPCHFSNVQYVPGMAYGLLSWGILDNCGLHIQGGNGVIKFLKPDGTVIIESAKKTEHLYYLNTVFNSPPTSDTTTTLAIIPSFDLLHKQLAHPRKDVLQLMIQEKLTDGMDDVSNDVRGFDCIACIQGKRHVACSRPDMRQPLSAWVGFTPMFVVLWMYCLYEKIVTSAPSWMTKPITSGSFPAPTNQTSPHGSSDLTHSLPTTMGLTQKSYDWIKAVNMSTPPLSHTVLRKESNWNTQYCTHWSRMVWLKGWTRVYQTRDIPYWRMLVPWTSSGQMCSPWLYMQLTVLWVWAPATSLPLKLSSAINQMFPTCKYGTLMFMLTSQRIWVLESWGSEDIVLNSLDILMTHQDTELMTHSLIKSMLSEPPYFMRQHAPHLPLPLSLRWTS